MSKASGPIERARKKRKPARRSPRSDALAGRDRFLSAADRVFVRYGYDGSTIRAIAEEAGTSLARLNRHWSGKEDLFREVFARHFSPIHAAQNARLDEVEAASGNNPPDLRAILKAFLEPALVEQVGEQAQSHLVYCRALVDPAPEAGRLAGELIQEVGPRVIRLLRRALPSPSPETFYLIVAIIMGAYIQPQLFGLQLAKAMGIQFESVDWDSAGTVIARLLVEGIGRPDKQG